MQDQKTRLIHLLPVERQTKTETQDLIRGFTDAELAEAQVIVPEREEPGLTAPIPRKVHVSGRAWVADQGRANGLSDVRVTDGEYIYLTEEDGTFSFIFDMDDDPHCRFVVVVCPSGYRLTTPFFLRIPHDEETVEYQVDFVFHTDIQDSQFSFLVASDSQFTRLEAMISIAKDFAQMTEEAKDLAFLMTVGDLTMSSTHYQWDMYDQIQGASQLPIYNSFGGHDGNCLTPRSTLNYELRIGPPYYSWDYGGVHFVQFVTEHRYLGERGQTRQDKWLEADLKMVVPETPVIVATHYPLKADWFDQRKAEGFKVICQLAAHWHCVQVGSRGSVPVLITAPARGSDWGSYSNAYRWVHITSNGVRSDLRVAGQYQRLEVISPAVATTLGQQPIRLLAYDSAKKVKTVRCRLADPNGVIQSTDLKLDGDWTWKEQFNPQIPGQWTFELDATDQLNQCWQQKHLVEVIDTCLADPVIGGDFPWILAGDPPRVLAEGPEPPLYPLWIQHTGSVHVLHASPVVAHGHVYVAVTNPNAGEIFHGICCFEAKTGQEIWRSPSPRGDIRGAVTVHEDCVYIVTGQGWAAAYMAKTGELLWAQPLKPAYADGRPLAINQTPPIPTKFGLLVSDWQSPQFLLNYQTGEEIRQFDIDIGYYAAFATIFDDILYIARRYGRSAIRLPLGEVVWEGEESARSTSAGIVVDGKFIYRTASSVKALDTETGEEIWDTPVANAGFQNPIPVVWDDLVLVNGTHFTAIDLVTSEIRWEVACAQDASRFERSQRQTMAGSSTPIVAGNYAYFGHDDTSIRTVNNQGHLVWVYRLGTPIKTAPVVCGNLLFAHDYSGNLWCFAPTV